MEYAMLVVNRLRKQRTDYGLTRQRPPVYVAVADEAARRRLAPLVADVATLTTSGEVVLVRDAAATAGSSSSNGGTVPRGCSVAIVDDVTTAYMDLKGILDPALELTKLDKKYKV